MHVVVFLWAGNSNIYLYAPIKYTAIDPRTDSHVWNDPHYYPVIWY